MADDSGATTTTTVTTTSRAADGTGSSEDAASSRADLLERLGKLEVELQGKFSEVKALQKTNGDIVAKFKVCLPHLSRPQRL